MPSATMVQAFGLIRVPALLGGNSVTLASQFGHILRNGFDQKYRSGDDYAGGGDCGGGTGITTLWSKNTLDRKSVV